MLNYIYRLKSDKFALVVEKLGLDGDPQLNE